jgi:membrane associated rhomboid family serine protease
MTWLVLLVVLGYIVYVLKPDERARVLARIRRSFDAAREAIHHRPQRQPDAFRAALEARTRGPYVSAFLLALNVVIFALMLTGSGSTSDPQTLVRWGASVGPLTTNGEWWRVVTATFVHSGIVPLLIDVAALAQTAILIERLFGHVALGGVYLTSAAFASAIRLSGDPLAVATGASGPIFGIEGLLVAVVVRGTLQRSPVTVPIRVLRRLAPAAVAFVAYYMWVDGAEWRSGLATFVVGFAIGLALTRNVAERTPHPRRVLSLATTSLVITVMIAVPLAGMTDFRSEVSRLIAVEDQSAATYWAATEQFRRGAIRPDALAEVIERDILPKLDALRGELSGLGGVPRQQQPLVASADEYLKLRYESWQLRARALHKSSMRMLREADEQERISLDALGKIKLAVAESPKYSS